MSGYGEFSEFECRKFAMKFAKDENYVEAGAVGSIEESMNTKTVTKKYMGIEKKTRTRGTGTGELKLSLHMNYERYKQTYGMNLDGLEDGISAYGSNSVHPEFACTVEAVDEDENIKYKAYTKCVVKDGIARKIETEDTFDTVTVLYTAYLCANVDNLDECMGEMEFMENLPYNPPELARKCNELISAKKKKASDQHS